MSKNIVKMRMRSRRGSAVRQCENVSRGFGRHADGQKVIVVNLGYFSA